MLYVEHRAVVREVVDGAALGAAGQLLKLPMAIIVYWSSVQPGNWAFAWARLQAMPAMPSSMLTSGLNTEFDQSAAFGSVSRSTWPFGSKPRSLAVHPCGRFEGSHHGPVCMEPRQPHSVPLQPRLGQQFELPVQPTASY